MDPFKPNVPKSKLSSKPISLHLEHDQQARLKAILKTLKPLSQQQLLRQMIEHCLTQMEKGHELPQHEVPPPPKET